jgi:hypothetical protein
MLYYLDSPNRDFRMRGHASNTGGRDHIHVIYTNLVLRHPHHSSLGGMVEATVHCHNLPYSPPPVGATWQSLHGRRRAFPSVEGHDIMSNKVFLMVAVDPTTSSSSLLGIGYSD